MIYFDTNVLIYFSIDQDPQKLALARKRIFEAIEEERFVLSSLVMSEYIFILEKLGILQEQKEKVDFFFEFATLDANAQVVQEAFRVCNELGNCKAINDAIHFALAKRHCQKLVTFNKDFKKFPNELLIEIL